jgi:hypothetical protein
MVFIRRSFAAATAARTHYRSKGALSPFLSAPPSETQLPDRAGDPVAQNRHETTLSHKSVTIFYSVVAAASRGRRATAGRGL